MDTPQTNTPPRHPQIQTLPCRRPRTRADRTDLRHVGSRMAEEITTLLQEEEQHLRAFEQLARRTVEEAWLAGDALLRIRQHLPHGAWLPALKDRGIAYTTASRSIRLRQQYAEINQVGEFGTVSAALTGGCRFSFRSGSVARSIPVFV